MVGRWVGGSVGRPAGGRWVGGSVSRSVGGRSVGRRRVVGRYFISGLGSRRRTLVNGPTGCSQNKPLDNNACKRLEHPPHTCTDTCTDTSPTQETHDGHLSMSCSKVRFGMKIHPNRVDQNQLKPACRQKWRVSVFNINKAATCLRRLWEAIFEHKSYAKCPRGGADTA